MTAVVRRWTTLALTVVLLGALAALTGPTATAGQTTAPRQEPSIGSQPVTLRLDGLAPRVVTPEGAPELLVTGRLQNTGAVSVRDLGLRVQRGAALTGDREARRALAGLDPAEEVRPDFTQVAGVLDPGEDLPFTLRVPLRGAPTSSLALTSAGVYPLLVNANGTLGAGAASRLGAVRLLLPVVGLPPATPGGPPAPPAAPAAGTATRVGVVYPIADRPRRLPVVPGDAPLLTDDDLATSLAPGGRLAGLVDALARSAPLGSPSAGSVCLAVDADLLETARAMAAGYRVQTPGGPVAGRGSAVAGPWLDALRAQARGRCVVALPYADTDLVATSRGNLTDLTTSARTTGATRVGDLLGVRPLPDTTWPAGGLVDERSLGDLATGGARTLLLDADALDGGAPSGGVARLAGPAGTRTSALALDPLATAAFAPRADDAARDVVGTSPAGTSAPLAAQDALATLVLRAQEADGPGAAPTSVLAAPTRWAAGPAEAGAFLDAVGGLARAGLVQPVDLGALTGAATAGAATPDTVLVAADAGPGLGDAAVARARVVRDQQRDLLAASDRDRIGTASPTDFFDPLTEGLMRSLSATWRGDPAAENGALTAVEGQMEKLRSMVRVLQPSGAYALGSNDAPLLLTVENRLPVAVRVQVALEPTPGLRTQGVPVVSVPAFGSRQLQVGVQVMRAGEFSVDARALTPGGEPLGPTARLLLRSTAYGTITVWLTASAAVVLVILASVRIGRRVAASRRDRRSRRRRSRRGGGPGPTTSDPGPTDPTEPPTRELQSR